MDDTEDVTQAAITVLSSSPSGFPRIQGGSHEHTPVVCARPLVLDLASSGSPAGLAISSLWLGVILNLTELGDSTCGSDLLIRICYTNVRSDYD